MKATLVNKKALLAQIFLYGFTLLVGIVSVRLASAPPPVIVTRVVPQTASSFNAWNEFIPISDSRPIHLSTYTPIAGSEFLLPEASAMCESWAQAHTDLIAEFLRGFSEADRDRIKAFAKSEVFEAVIADPDFNVLFEARYWLIENRSSSIPDLIDLLDNPIEVGLKGSGDVIISERIESGQLRFYGHGWVVSDDLFQVAGRASWLLKEVTGLDFGSISMYSSLNDLNELQARWRLWHNQFDCE